MSNVGVEYTHINLNDKGAGLQTAVGGPFINAPQNQSAAERDIGLDAVSGRINFKTTP